MPIQDWNQNTNRPMGAVAPNAEPHGEGPELADQLTVIASLVHSTYCAVLAIHTSLLGAAPAPEALLSSKQSDAVRPSGLLPGMRYEARETITMLGHIRNLTDILQKELGAVR